MFGKHHFALYLLRERREKKWTVLEKDDSVKLVVIYEEPHKRNNFYKLHMEEKLEDCYRSEYTLSIPVLAYTWVPLAVARNFYHQMAADHKPWHKAQHPWTIYQRVEAGKECLVEFQATRKHNCRKAVGTTYGYVFHRCKYRVV